MQEHLNEHECTKEDNSRLALWELKQGATALQEANKLIQEREYYYESLYDDIRYFAVRYSDEPTQGCNPSTEYQALAIIDAKIAYDKRIERLKEKYVRWKGFLQNFNESDADLLKRYFEEGDPIPQHTIDRLLLRAGRKLIKYDMALGKALDAEAREKYKEHLANLRSEKPPKPLANRMDKQQYLVKGSFVYMTEEEYQEHLESVEHSRITFEEMMHSAT